MRGAAFVVRVFVLCTFHLRCAHFFMAFLRCAHRAALAVVFALRARWFLRCARGDVEAEA